MSLFEVPELRQHVPVIAQGVTDIALQLLLDSIEQEITARRGPATGPITEQHLGRVRVITLHRPATGNAGINSIVESMGAVSTTLASDDWLLWPNLMTLSRLPFGTNRSARWGEQVIVTFTPRDDTAERKRVAVALAKLDLAYSGYAGISTQSENRSSIAAGYRAEREALLDSFALTSGQRF